MSQSWMAESARFAEQQLAESQTPGMMLGIAAHGEPLYQQGFGWRDAEANLPLTPETVLGIGSITKTITAVAIMQLQERGKLHLQDPLIKYLPEFRLPGGASAEPITLHHLLSHSAGLPPLPALSPAMRESLLADPHYPAAFRERLEKEPYLDTYGKLIDYIASQEFRLLGVPGAYFSYSNEGFGLLGAVIERVDGRDYATYVTEEILVPAGMVRATFDPEELASWENVTQLYLRNEQGVIPAPGWYQGPAMLAAGFLRCSTADLLRFMELFRTGGLVGDHRLLSAESVAAMTTPHMPISTGLYYGYGLQVIPDFHGTRLVGHGGAVKGVQAYAVCLPEHGVTGVAMTNLQGAPASKVLQGALGAYLGKPVEERWLPYSEVTPDREELQRFTGTFTSQEGGSLTFEVEEDRLIAVVPGTRMTLRQVGRQTFLIPIGNDEMELSFMPGADGEISGISLALRMWPKG